MTKNLRATNADLDNINMNVDAIKNQIAMEMSSFDTEYKAKRLELEQEIHKLNSESRKVAKMSRSPEATSPTTKSQPASPVKTTHSTSQVRSNTSPSSLRTHL